MNGPAVFTKSSIRKKAPLASESTINRTLQLLKTDGIIRPLVKVDQLPGKESKILMRNSMHNSLLYLVMKTENIFSLFFMLCKKFLLLFKIIK